LGGAWGEDNRHEKGPLAGLNLAEKTRERETKRNATRLQPRVLSKRNKGGGGKKSIAKGTQSLRKYTRGKKRAAAKNSSKGTPGIGVKDG